MRCGDRFCEGENAEVQKANQAKSRILDLVMRVTVLSGVKQSNFEPEFLVR